MDNMKMIAAISNSLNDIASATKMTSNINAFSFILKSPQTVFFSVIAIIIMCAVLYVLVEFFSKNRFRGISFNMFSKLITVTDYINRFNTQLYLDFKNIKTYNEQLITNTNIYKLGDDEYKNKVYFTETNKLDYKNSDKNGSTTSITLLNAISKFMSDGKIETQKDFNQKINKFFQPNPSFKKNITDNELYNLKSIFEALYGEEFHKQFSDWFNYDSIWNFAYKDSSDGNLDKNLLTLQIYNSKNSDGTKDIPQILSETIDGKDKDSENSLKEYISKNNFDSAMTKMEDYMNGIKSLISQKATNKILDNMIREWKDEVIKLKVNEEKNKEAIEEYEKKISEITSLRTQLMNDVNSLFFSKSTINYESISQQLNESCSLLDDDAKQKFLNEFNEMSIGQGKLKNIVESMSFINVLDALRKSNYNVTHTTLRGINNIHPHIIEVFESINVDSKREEKASILYNACFEVFNEFIYTKYMYNEVGEFMFLEADEVNDLSKNDLYNNVLQYFNVHMILLYKDNIKFAKHFNSIQTSTNKNTFDSITEAHVSIARLKYLIQDYFVIIMEYNDKSFPDPSDIRDFWQKRVNSFGISMPGTKKFNRPRDAPDIDYVATRTNRSRKNKSGERSKLFNEDGNVMDDLDQVLKKNTPYHLYKEYFWSIFGTRHPKIPFFQSIIAGIRFMFPDPNTVLDNFLAQLKGKPPSSSNKQINFDFSFKYDPYTRVIDGMVDRFSDPEVGVDKMEDVVDLETHDASGIQAEAAITNDKAQKEGTAGAVSAKVGTTSGTNFGTDPLDSETDTE